jgi:hypothetical protein
MAVPMRPTEGLDDALELTLRTPVREPVAVGLNVTVTVQDEFAASVVQLLVCAKSPDAAMPEIVAELESSLVMVTV